MSAAALRAMVRGAMVAARDAESAARLSIAIGDYDGAGRWTWRARAARSLAAALTVAAVRL